MRKLIVALTLALSLPLSAEPVDQLASLLSGYERFSANFEQFATSEQGERREASSGNFAVARPDRFVWNTLKPFPQQIISDGEYVWIYDEDLEQATRKPGNQNTESAPALILNGRIHELEMRYDVSLIQQTGNLMVFELLPKAGQDAMFTRVRLLFEDAVLSEFMLDDNLGQRSTILLSDTQLDPELDEAIFRFTPPDDIDVILDEAP
ncbi:outer membrane lipoprotein chaperone LolA [Nitrincola tapanii]|uniref:Outer-membrane lipoprotein carrier protein n=1 Tax=Nitrincola tapanii TaxID=1708751 RepID=A0A5A9W5M7_9GAMM|nr:outer membrane lipoprotein chaperone LolA [Nitrincola tapanii]KAA0875398.1 outer membrane lipoprotein chaperone LolA [Nitrincola tapanii]